MNNVRKALEFDSSLLERLDHRSIQILPDGKEVRFSFDNLEINLLSIAKDPINPNMYYVEHCHDSYELRYVESGMGYMNISGMNITVSQNDLYLVGPKVMHRRRSDVKNPLMEYCIKFDLRLRGSSTRYEPGEKKLVEVLSNPYPYVFTATEPLLNTLDEVIRLYLTREAGYQMDAKIRFLSMLSQLYHTIAAHRQTEDGLEDPSAPSSLRDDRIRKIIDYVEVNLNNNIRIEHVQQLLQLSPKQINRLMKNCFGMTFHDYLDKFRLDIAKDLLEHTSRSVSDIAFMSGFSNPQQMYRLFKARMNCSPNDYRGQASKKTPI